jgi:hypothetical protein
MRTVTPGHRAASRGWCARAAPERGDCRPLEQNLLDGADRIRIAARKVAQAHTAREALDVARSRLRDHPEAVTVQERALVDEAARLVDSD